MSCEIVSIANHAAMPAFLLAATLLGCSSGADIPPAPEDLATRLRHWGLILRRTDLFAESLEERAGAAAGSTLLVARGRDRILRVGVRAVADRGAAWRRIEEEERLLLSIFQPSLPPYPEFLTREAGCPEAFHPRPVETAAGRLHLLYAGERLGYGVCNRELARWRVGVIDFYCPAAGRLFKVEYIAPNDTHDSEFVALFDGLACNESPTSRERP